MALMKFREPNQVKWVGVRPGHNGTQIIRSQGADNATVELYLVPVGQTFYLCSASLGYRLVVDGYVKLFINDLVPAQWFLCFEDVLLALSPAQTVTDSYWPPIEVPAGYTFYIQSAGAGLQAWGQIHGWVE